MTDQRIQYTEKMVGAGHPTKADTLNRLALIEHNTDGTHKALTQVTDPWVDVRAYGAAWDGTTDDTAEIQAAADAAVIAGIPLFLPPGTGKVTSAIRTSAEIFGISPLKSILYNAGTGDALDLGGGSY